MGEETWHAARLIPTSGINGVDEQERRATSALLAVLTSVKEFGRAVTSRVGAPAGAIETYVEVPFLLGEREVFPDGLIRVRRGKTVWTALVEVKTGAQCLEQEQLERYLDIARIEGFDAVVTVSNEIVAVAGSHPTAVDKRKLRKVELHHLSWTRVLTEATMQKIHKGVADPDQAWILGELIRYLEHPRSGALEFDDMGPHWVSVREAVRAGTLRSGDRGGPEIAARWDQLIRYACLRLGRQLGTEVQPVLSRRETAEPAARLGAVHESLTSRAILEGAVRIPNTIAPVKLAADLKAGQVHASATVEAPRTGRSATRVGWMLRQLRGAPDSLRIESHAAHSRNTTAELLRIAREQPGSLIDDPKREIRAFTVTMTHKLGHKRAGGRGSFISSVLDCLDEFYSSTVQDLKPWAAPAPKMRSPETAEPVSVPLMSTALSSQDGPEPQAPSRPAEVVNASPSATHAAENAD